MEESSFSVNYDKISRVYDSSRAANTETVNNLITLLRINSSSLVLDVGCGTGNYGSILNWIAGSVIGLDSSIGMITRASVKFPELLLINGAVTHLPLKPDIFDGLFSIQVLHHVENKALFFSEAYRVLKNGSWMAVDSASHKQLETFWVYHYFSEGLNIDKARIPDTRQIVEFMQVTGFVNVGIVTSYTNVEIHHKNPERYLEKEFRDGQSTFHLMTEEEIEIGCNKLKRDVASGEINSIVQEFERKEREVGGSSIIYGQKLSTSITASTGYESLAS